MRKLKSVRLLPALFIIGLLSLGLNTGGAQDTTGDLERTPVLMTQDETAVLWKDGPETMPPGTKIAILEGDPNKPGPLTMRLLLPAGSDLRPHTHPGDERVTVLSGSLHFGLGEIMDTSTSKVYGPGSFFVIPAGNPMFAFTTDEETVLQLNVEGPWGITYLDTVG